MTIAVVAALAGTLGDLLLLATSNATRPGFEWLPAPSEAVLLVGTFLGVIAIPCYGLGYRAIAARFAEPYRRWIGALGVAGAVLGGTTHGLTGLVIHVERSGGAAGVDPLTVIARYGAFLGPLWTALALLSVVGSIAFVAGQLGGRSSLPRWTALLNPALVTVGFVLAGAPSDAGRAFLVPAAPNVAHVVLFALLSVVMVPLDTPRRGGH